MEKLVQGLIHAFTVSILERMCANSTFVLDSGYIACMFKAMCATAFWGLSNTPKLSPMEEGHEQPDSPEDSSRET